MRSLASRRVMRWTAVAAVLGALGCGTGPNARGGTLPCTQLKQCICTPDRVGSNGVDSCNSGIDQMANQTDGQKSCQNALAGSGCGTQLQVNPQLGAEASGASEESSQ